MTDNSQPQQPWGGPPQQPGPPQQQWPPTGAPQSQPYGGPPQQPYGGPHFAGQPYAGPSATPATSAAPRIVGWLLVLVGLLAIGATFGPWVKAGADGVVQSVPVSMKASVNAYDHSSCSITPAIDQACDSDEQSGSSGDATANERQRSMWEGWALAPIGVLLVILGIARGLGKRAFSLPSAVVGIVAGCAIIGTVISRWTWISDRSGEINDRVASMPGTSGLDTSFGSGWGLWLALAAGVCALLVGVGGVVKRP